MTKMKAKKLLAITIALAIFSTIPLGVSAKSQNSTDIKVNENSTQVKVTFENQIGSSTSTSAIKVKPPVKSAISNQLTELGIKLNGIESDTNKIIKAIDAFIKSNTTGSAIATTTGTAVTTTETAITVTSPAAVTTSGSALSTTGSAIGTTAGAIITTGPAIKITGSAINVKENKTAFVNSTSGKLKALSNRLTAVEKSLKALSGKVDKNSSDQYKSLVSKVAAIKAKISKEMGMLKLIQ